MAVFVNSAAVGHPDGQQVLQKLERSVLGSCGLCRCVRANTGLGLALSCLHGQWWHAGETQKLRRGQSRVAVDSVLRRNLAGLSPAQLLLPVPVPVTVTVMGERTHGGGLHVDPIDKST
ncbi:hypothetical protein MG293_014318 [Ovis ammon polii]|uniref:Uncharacterized protein n=1 Tax=Ovis ammon polii TaxID=230172 RepID=A0AAD4Y5F9_OVIAM|nr:hypothetical protein MG293_014318 [Ovis ammon polii]